MITTLRTRSCSLHEHRSYRTLAQCLYRRAEWINGEGPYAVLAHCRVLTVTLWKNLPAAEEAKRMIDGGACGGRCSGDHQIVELLKTRDRMKRSQSYTERSCPPD
jgi:hypothetical protein